MFPKNGDGHLTSGVFKYIHGTDSQTEISQSEPSFLTKFLIDDYQPDYSFHICCVSVPTGKTKTRISTLLHIYFCCFVFIHVNF